MRFPSRPKAEIVDESFVDAASSAESTRTSASAGTSSAEQPPAEPGASKPEKSSSETQPSTRRRRPPSPTSSPPGDAGAVTVLKSFRIPIDLARRLEALARVTTKTQTRIVVEAATERVAELEEEYRRRAGQDVPDLRIVEIE